jgi:predicted amidohydrolase
VVGREDAVDERAQAAAPKVRHDLVSEALHGRRLLLGRPRAEDGAVDRRALAHQRAERELAFGAGARADDDEAAFRCERVEVAGEVHRADELEHDVRSAGGVRCRNCVVGCYRLCSELPELLVGRACRREHACARGDPDLHGGGADAAVRAGHEEHLAEPEPPAGEERVVRRDEDLGDGGRVLVGELVGNPRDVALVHGDSVGEAAAADEPEDAVAGRKAAHGRSRRDDDAGHLEPRNVLRRARRRWVVTCPLGEVCRVHPGKAGRDDELLGAGNRVGSLFEAHDLLAAGPGEDDRPHSGSFADAGRRLAAMRLALAQLDATLGDVEANEARVRAVLADAAAAGADLVVFPELYLSGYALHHAAGDSARSPEHVAALATSGPAALVGFHEPGHSSAAYVEHGVVVHVHRKLYLVDYPPFREDALFEPGGELRAFDTPLGRFAILVCNDAWQPFLPFLAVCDRAEVLLVPACSSDVVPEAEGVWRALTRHTARLHQCYVVFVNRVGAEPGFAFWGGSHVVAPTGEVVAEAPRLEEALLLVDLDLEEVARCRREPSLLGPPRLEFLRDELSRLAAAADRTNCHG